MLCITLINLFFNFLNQFIYIKNTPQFFLLSTMDPPATPNQNNIDDVPTFSQFQANSKNKTSTNPYYFQIMNYQNMLNLELLKNRDLVAAYVYTRRILDKDKNSIKGVSSTSQGAQTSLVNPQNFHTVLYLQRAHNRNRYSECKAIVKEQTQNNKAIKKFKLVQSDQEYEPEVSGSQNFKISKSSESKNVPKNFSKALLAFIKKKQNLIKKLVEQQGIDFSEFMKVASNLKGKISTIAELRSIWIEQSNKFAKIFRILSNLYIKRYSLQRIFNSRIQDFSKHLKYRQKMGQVIRNPAQFTRMKDY